VKVIAEHERQVADIEALWKDGSNAAQLCLLIERSAAAQDAQLFATPGQGGRGR
jgi:hypothetical protein